MGSIKGTLIIRKQCIGTKSEGDAALLIGYDLKIYKLGREDHYSIDDNYFYTFDRQDVEVIGDVIDDEYIVVYEIRSISTNKNNHEENMSSM